MKLLHKKGFVQKILIIILTIMMFNFVVPVKTQAAMDGGIGGTLFTPIFALLKMIADVPVGLLQHSLLDTTAIFDSVTLDEDDVNVIKEEGAWYAKEEEFNEKDADGNKVHITKELKYGERDGVNDDGKYDGYIDSSFVFWDREIEIPNILYCPEYIFFK